MELVPTKRYDATASCTGCQGSYVLGQSECCGIACKVILLSLLKYKVFILFLYSVLVVASHHNWCIFHLVTLVWNSIVNQVAFSDFRATKAVPTLSRVCGCPVGSVCVRIQCPGKPEKKESSWEAGYSLASKDGQAAGWSGGDNLQLTTWVLSSQVVETCSTEEVVDQIDSKDVATVCAIPEEDRKKETK